MPTVREQLVQEATRQLYNRGVTVGLQHIRLAEVAEAAGTSRATAYRSLAHPTLDPQDALRDEVEMRLLARSGGAHFRAELEAAVTEELNRQSDTLGSPNLAVRREGLREMVRIGGNASYNAITLHNERAILISYYGSIQSQKLDGAPEQLEQLRNGEREVIGVFSDLYMNLVTLYDMELKDGVTIDHFTTAVVSMVEGMSVRSGFNDHLAGIKLRTGPDGSEQVWTLFALALDGMLFSFFQFADL